MIIQLVTLLITFMSAIAFIIVGNIPASILLLFVSIILSFLSGVEHGVNIKNNNG